MKNSPRRSTLAPPVPPSGEAEVLKKTDQQPLNMMIRGDIHSRATRYLQELVEQFGAPKKIKAAGYPKDKKALVEAALDEYLKKREK